jgi:heat shock protein HslJ
MMSNSRKIPLLALGLAIAGCAPTPAPPPIANMSGTKWHVVSVNGRQTPAKSDYSLRFGADNSFGARFGCNAMGGDYRLSGATLTVDHLISTLMACGEPSASFESQGSAILGQPMQVAFTSNGRMNLSNSAGSISLDPVS